MADKDVLAEFQEETKNSAKNVPAEKGSKYGTTVLALIEREPKNKLPLILYIISLVFLGVMAVLLALNDGLYDWNWTIAIHEWVVASPLAIVILGWPKLIGGAMAFVVTFLIAFIIVILPRKNTIKIVKYAGIFVVSGLIGLIINRILMGLSTRLGPAEINQVVVLFTLGGSQSLDGANFSVWYAFLSSGNTNSWMTGSFTSFTMTFAGIIIGFPYCFNGDKGKVLKIVTGILAFVYMVFMGLGLIATYQNWLSDVIFAGVIQYWIVAATARKILSVREQELMDVYDRVHLPMETGYRRILKAKSILELTEVPYLLEKTKKVVAAEDVNAKKAQEKGKPLAYGEKLPKIIELLEKAIAKMPADKIDVPDLLKEISGELDAVMATEKPPKSFGKLNENISLCNRILADNKAVALEALDEAVEYYNKSKQAAEVEIGDFKHVIERADVWLKYIERFKAGLTELKQTVGTEFQAYMKDNFIYII
jgi:hypothetical protein